MPCSPPAVSGERSISCAGPGDYPGAPGRVDCIRFHSRQASSNVWPSDVRLLQFLHSNQPSDPPEPTRTVPVGRSPHVEHGRMRTEPLCESGSRLIGLPLLVLLGAFKN